MGSELNGGRGQLYLRISIHITRMGILQRARENESDDGQKGQGERERERAHNLCFGYVHSICVWDLHLLLLWREYIYRVFAIFRISSYREEHF